MGKRQKRGALLLRDYEVTLAQARADRHKEEMAAEVRGHSHQKLAWGDSDPLAVSPYSNNETQRYSHF